MNNSTNTIIVLLTVTAAILGAILIGSYTAGPAYAETSVKQGDYLMGALGWKGDLQLVYVIDMAANKLNTYAIAKAGGGGAATLSLGETIDLSKVFLDKK